MPGPMADCAKSTGAMLLSCNFFKAGRSSRFSSAIRLRRVACGASAGRLRHTSTMEDARALTLPFSAVVSSVRIGHVPVIEKPALTIALSIVSQPVDAVCFSASFSSVSLCL